MFTFTSLHTSVITVTIGDATELPAGA